MIFKICKLHDIQKIICFLKSKFYVHIRKPCFLMPGEMLLLWLVKGNCTMHVAITEELFYSCGTHIMRRSCYVFSIIEIIVVFH